VYFSFLLLCFLVFVLPSGVIKNDMVYRTVPFSMTLTPNPRVRFRVRVRVGKVRKPYPNFQMVPLSMTLSDL